LGHGFRAIFFEVPDAWLGSLQHGAELGCAKTRPFGELVLLTADFRKK